MGKFFPMNTLVSYSWFTQKCEYYSGGTYDVKLMAYFAFYSRKIVNSCNARNEQWPYTKEKLIPDINICDE